MQELINIDEFDDNLSDNDLGEELKANHSFPSNYSSLPIQELRMRAQKLGIKNHETLDKIMLIEEFIKLDQSKQ